MAPGPGRRECTVYRRPGAGGMPLALHLSDGLSRTFSDLEHIAFWIVAVASPEAAGNPFLRLRAYSAAEFRCLVAGIFDARDRQADLDRVLFSNLRGRGDLDCCRDLLRYLVHDDLETILVQNDVVLVPRYLSHLCDLHVEPPQEFNVLGEDHGAGLGSCIHGVGGCCGDVSEGVFCAA